MNMEALTVKQIWLLTIINLILYGLFLVVDGVLVCDLVWKKVGKNLEKRARVHCKEGLILPS